MEERSEIVVLPKVINDRIDELNDLVDKHPQYIPLPEAAKFLGVNPEGLRYGIEQGTIDFGICWAKPKRYKKGKKQVIVTLDENGNRAFKIPTLTFYLWITRGETLKAGYEYSGKHAIVDEYY